MYVIDLNYLQISQMFSLFNTLAFGAQYALLFSDIVIAF